ncbi:HAD-IA family hydrolase [Streptomyces sp. NPDC051453]|uniref:HAD-IA family hydrolase n=1 Tax=Streptomyces sp. NPDC051453 TaxID=3154941 RepID=UPI003428D162
MRHYRPAESAALARNPTENHHLVPLPNVDRHYWQLVQAMHPELGFFSELLMSCDLGVAEPDAEAFRRASRAAGTNPEHCFFADDTMANMGAAKALGFQARWFRDAPGLHRALRGA